MKIFPIGRPRREQCSIVLGGEGRPLTLQGSWNLNDRKSQLFLLSCAFSPLHSSPQIDNSLGAFATFHLPRMETIGILYSPPSPGICQRTNGLFFTFLLPTKNSLIIRYFARLSWSSSPCWMHYPSLHPLCATGAFSCCLTIFVFCPFPKCHQ